MAFLLKRSKALNRLLNSYVDIRCKYHTILFELYHLVNGAPKRSKISVQFNDLGFRLMSPGDLTDDELDATLDLLHNRSISQEKTQLLQVNYIRS